MSHRERVRARLPSAHTARAGGADSFTHANRHPDWDLQIGEVVAHGIDLGPVPAFRSQLMDELARGLGTSRAAAHRPAGIARRVADAVREELARENAPKAT